MFMANRWDNRDTHYWPSFQLLDDQSKSSSGECPTVVWNFRKSLAAGVGSGTGVADCGNPHRLGEPTVSREDRKPRGLLWVDAVGGFLLYPTDEITVGQAVPGTDVDLPILGDLSRKHVVIQRFGSDYVVRPIGPTVLDGRILDGPTPLTDGDTLHLGGIRLRFRQPNPLSSTACLDIISQHRTQPSSDGIVLLAETCLLGPKEDNHIVCRDWEGQVILMPAGDGRFRFKAEKSVTIDDISSCDTGVIAWGSRLASDDFAFMLERL